ncbi:nucleoside-diphosphatase [Lyophyllum atratum]|nr:nucleoside-diphosphatase [Lyophyllum atratum]
MPPPTGLDPWMAGRHFGVVIDAGSSGSRLQIYSWTDPRSIGIVKDGELEFTLPKVEKGTKDGDDWVTKVEPGISSFADNPEGVAKYLQPLLSHARNHIPPSLEKQTPLFLLATAGMRLLTPAKQAEILQEACRFLSLHSTFKIDAASDVGPCGSSVRIITGEEEGLFGWIAVNYLMDGFTGSSQNRTTYGFLDMGGASTQIAFEPGNVSDKEAKNLIDVRLRLLGGREVKHKVFVTTWLGYGTNQARERYVGKAIREFEPSRAGGQKDVVLDPCLPKGLELIEKPVHDKPSNAHATKAHRLKGTGSFEQCMQKSSALLNKTAPCPDAPCLMDGIHVPPIDFSVSHFIGVSEYWYSSEHVFGLGGAYDFVQYERAAANFCARDWDGIMQEHKTMKAQHRLGGDGEVEKDGQVVEVGQWHPSVERSRLEMQCFKAAWIANVLHEGIGIPRITDPGGNVTTEGDKIEKEAAKKGLGRPAFQSLDTVGDIAISWTLGKMVLEASKEIPASSNTARPLVDPIDEMPDSPDFHIKRIRPLWTLDGLEERITPLLPTKLTRTSLGFSPVLFLLLISFLFFTIVAYPLRRQLRAACLRSIRRVTKREEGYSLEDGIMFKGQGYLGNSRPGSPTSATQKWLYPIRRVFSSTGTKPQPNALSVITSSNPKLRHINTMPARSYSLPNDLEVTASSSQYAPRSSISRSPSPSPAFLEDSYFPSSNNLLSNGAPSLARSRNTSQMNLSGSARQGSYQSPGKGLDE